MTKKVNDQPVQVILSNQMGYERIAMACSATFAQMFGFTQNRIEDLKTIVAEATINAMEHGNKGRPDAKVAIFIHSEDDAIYVTVIDEGDGIYEFPPNPDIDRIINSLDPPIGFGLFLIKQLADHVEFNKMKDGGHMVKMAVKMKT